MTKRTCLFALSLLLSSCALPGGGHARIQTSSPSGITILTDSALLGLPQARQAAQAHCAQYGRNAVQVSVGKSRFGQAPVAFACR